MLGAMKGGTEQETLKQQHMVASGLLGIWLYFEATNGSSSGLDGLNWVNPTVITSLLTTGHAMEIIRSLTNA